MEHVRKSGSSHGHRPARLLIQTLEVSSWILRSKIHGPVPESELQPESALQGLASSLDLEKLVPVEDGGGILS